MRNVIKFTFHKIIQVPQQIENIKSYNGIFAFMLGCETGNLIVHQIESPFYGLALSLSRSMCLRRAVCAHSYRHSYLSRQFPFSRGAKYKCNMVSAESAAIALKSACVWILVSPLGRRPCTYIVCMCVACVCVCVNCLATWANISCSFCLIFIYRTAAFCATAILLIVCMR